MFVEIKDTLVSVPDEENVRVGFTQPTIIDTDFEEPFPKDYALDARVAGHLSDLTIAWIDVIIATYEKHNANVAGNVIRIFQWVSHGNLQSIRYRHDTYKEHSDKYKQYADEIEKLLVLL